MKHHLPPLAEEVREILMREAGQRESIASEIGALVDEHVRRNHAGEKVARMSRAARAARAAQIRAEFNGANLIELSHRYQLHKVHVRRLIKAT